MRRYWLRFKAHARSELRKWREAVKELADAAENSTVERKAEPGRPLDEPRFHLINGVVDALETGSVPVTKTHVGLLPHLLTIVFDAAGALLPADIFPIVRTIIDEHGHSLNWRRRRPKVQKPVKKNRIGPPD